MGRNWLCWSLVVLGFVQMIGYVTNQKAIRGVGAITVAAPLPLVFTTMSGWETFSPEFYFRYKQEHGPWKEVQLTPEIYGQLDAPYQYRNVIGAAFAYGPYLPESMWRPVLNHAFIEPGRATQILGLEEPPSQAVIILKARGQAEPSRHELVLP